MTGIALNAEQLAELNGCNGRAEFIDEHSNVVGFLMTDASFDRIASFLLPMPTKEELAEARKEMLERGGVSTEEILAAIQSATRKWESLNGR